MQDITPILLVSLALSVSAGVGCNRNAASKTNEGGEELIEQTSPIAKTGDGEGAKSEEDGPERFEALFTTWSVAPEALEELEGTCDVAPISQLARPVVCWSSKRGWLDRIDRCLSDDGKKRQVYTTTADILEVGQPARGCDYNGDTIEGVSLEGKLPERYYYGMLATSKEAVTRAKELCEVVELPDADAAKTFGDVRFDEAIMTSILERYKASDVTPPACLKQLEGKSLKELLDADFVHTNDAYMKAQLDGDESLETLLPLHMSNSGCDMLMLLEKDEGAWSVARYADPTHQVGEEGWSYFHATDKCTDLDGDGVAEIWLPNGGETERAYHLVTPRKGVLRKIGKPHYYGD